MIRVTRAAPPTHLRSGVAVMDTLCGGSLMSARVVFVQSNDAESASALALETACRSQHERKVLFDMRGGAPASHRAEALECSHHRLGVFRHLSARPVIEHARSFVEHGDGALVIIDGFETVDVRNQEMVRAFNGLFRAVLATRATLLVFLDDGPLPSRLRFVADVYAQVERELDYVWVWSRKSRVGIAGFHMPCILTDAGLRFRPEPGVWGAGYGPAAPEPAAS